MSESTSTKAAILREIEDLLELHSWFPKTHEYPHVWEWYKGMKWGSSEEGKKMREYPYIDWVDNGEPELQDDQYVRLPSGGFLTNHIGPMGKDGLPRNQQGEGINQ